MKHFFAWLFLCNLLFWGSASAQVSVTATGGTLGPTTYTDFITAFTAINNGTHTGSITVAVSSSFSQSSTAVLNASGTGSASYTAVLIKPATGTTPVITNTADNTASIELKGADNVTIDGSNAGNTSRDMTFQNSNSSGTGVSCNIWLASDGTNGATNNTIKNCKVLGSSYSLGAAYMGVCVYSSSSTLTGYWLSTSVTTGANSNNIIQNNLFNSANAAVVFNGGATLGETGNQVIGNTIGDVSSGTSNRFTNVGVFMMNQTNFVIDQNTISWFNTVNTNVVPGGISIGTGCSFGNITRNTIKGLRFTTTTTEGGIVLNSGALANINVYNNFISDIASSGSATVANNAYGIAIMNGSSYNIIYNSVNMNTDPTTTATGYQAALYIATVPTITTWTIKNNLFIHSGTNTTNKYSFYITATPLTTSQLAYNDYYNTGATLAYAAAALTTLADVTTYEGGTATSKNVMPVFVAATDLHLVATDAGNLASLAGAANPQAGITVDHDGNPRGAAPTIGAHEITAVSCIAPSAPTATAITTNSASLDWTQTGSATHWQIKYGPAGFNVNTGGTTIYTTTKPYPLNTPPLTPATSYDFYVRAVCGAGDTSVWAPVKNFSTLCVAPSILTAKDSFNCGTGVVNLEATTTTGAAIKWYTALTGGTAINIGNYFTTPSLTTTTNYYIAAIAGTCESSPRQMITAAIRPIPTVNLGHDTTICPGVAYTFDAGNAGATYLWSTGATTQTVVENAAGNYIVKVTLNKCVNSDTILVTPGITPVAVLPVTTNLCAGSVATLSAGNPGSSYVWTPGGATTQSIDATTTGSYSVQVRSADGCSITSSTNLIVRAVPVGNLGNDTSICESASIVLNAGNAGNSFLWNTGQTTQTITVADSGKYVVTVKTPFNCITVDSQHVAFLASPRTEGFSFVPQFFDQLGKVLFTPLNPTDVSSYEWDFGDGSPHVTQMNPVHVYTASGDYFVTLKVYNDCTDFSQTQMIHVDLTATAIATINKNDINLNVYPNPAKAMITISNNSPEYKMESITIFNALGAVVYQQQTNSASRHEMSVAGFANGLYYARILTDKGFVNKQFQVVK